MKFKKLLHLLGNALFIFYVIAFYRRACARIHIRRRISAWFYKYKVILFFFHEYHNCSTLIIEVGDSFGVEISSLWLTENLKNHFYVHDIIKVQKVLSTPMLVDTDLFYHTLYFLLHFHTPTLSPLFIFARIERRIPILSRNASLINKQRVGPIFQSTSHNNFNYLWHI